MILPATHEWMDYHEMILYCKYDDLQIISNNVSFYLG